MSAADVKTISKMADMAVFILTKRTGNLCISAG